MDQLAMRFDADPRLLATVRDFARDAAHRLGADVDVDLMLVVVGELAANAAIHQEHRAEITVRLLADCGLEVSVTDPGSGMPRLVSEAPWSTDGHRGIQLVAALADSWGVDELDAGKRVWARLAPLTDAEAG